MNKDVIFQPKESKGEYKFNVCKCGHTESSHDSILLIISGKCEKCQCKGYDKIANLSYRELRELQKNQGINDE